MTATITTYREGRFTTEPQPDWWEAELHRAFDTHECDQGRFGEDEGGNGVGIVELHAGRGRLVTFTTTHVRATVDVWAATDADFLDLLTSRAPTFIGLSRSRPIATSLDALCNALIAYARHGSGDHIDRHDGRSEIDARQDEAYERRLADLQAAGRKVAAP